MLLNSWKIKEIINHIDMQQYPETKEIINIISQKKQRCKACISNDAKAKLYAFLKTSKDAMDIVKRLFESKIFYIYFTKDKKKELFSLE